MLKAMILGALIATGVMLALSLLGGVLLSKEVLPESAAKFMAWIICGAATLTGCWLAQKKAGGARLPVSMGAGGLLLLLLLAISAIGEDKGSYTWYSAAITAGCALISALLGAGKKKRRI